MSTTSHSLLPPYPTYLCKGTVWSWSSVEQPAFNQLWEALVTPPILHLPSLDLPFVLSIDASDTHIGAVLEQAEQHVAIF